MRKSTRWTGTYRDITFEIQNFDLVAKDDAWTFYLYIKLVQLPEDIWERFWLKPEKYNHYIRYNYERYNYDEEPLIASLDWHCGCTYYKKHGHDGELRVVQIGCDYQHLYDEGKYYNEEIIYKDVQRCIDSLHERIPVISRRCNYCGEYFVPTGDEKRCSECKLKGR